MEKIYKLLSLFFKYVLYISMYFIWIYYYNQNLIISIALSVALSLITDFIIGIFIKRKNKYAVIKNAEKKLITDFSTQFLFSTTYQNINYFCELFNNPETKKYKTHLVINNTTFVPFYSKVELTENDVYLLFKSINVKTKNFVILCKSVSDGGINLSKSIENYNFVILNENDVYFKFLKPLNAKLPNVITFKKQKKLNGKELFAIALNKHTAKGYFSSAFIILLSSLFIKFKIYYIIFAFLLFLLCYFSYFNVWFNKEKPNNFV